MRSTSYLRLVILAVLLAAATLLGTLFTFSDDRPALAAPPVNDNFADSIAIGEPLPFTDSRNTSGATAEGDEPSPCSDILSTVWYRFTPSSDISLIADTVGSDFDTVLAVYTGSAVDSLTVVACNDDISFPENPQSGVAFAAEAGMTYHFQVGGFSGDEGNLVFNVASASAPTPTPAPTPTSTPTPTPTPPPDSDGDGVPDASDNCPAWPNPNQSLPTWPIPADDADCDGFTDADEGIIGTDPGDPCAHTTDPNDEDDDRWPADFDDNQVINITDVFPVLPPMFGSSAGQADFSIRADLNPDGVINLTDVFKVLPPIFGQSCTS